MKIVTRKKLNHLPKYKEIDITFSGCEVLSVNHGGSLRVQSWAGRLIFFKLLDGANQP